MKNINNKQKRVSDTDKALTKAGTVNVTNKVEKQTDAFSDIVTDEKDEVKAAEERMRRFSKEESPNRESKK